VGWLKITEDARLEIDEASRERLLGRDYALVPTSPELLLGVSGLRDPAAANAVILAGDLEQIAFPEVVSLIAHARTTGVLRVFGSSGMRTVVFVDGEVRGTATERIDERLGEVAVRMDLLTQEDLDSLRDGVGVNRRTGRLAVERGLLSERDLWNAIQEHVISVFQAIVLEAHGAFVLTDEAIREALTVPGLAAGPLLMEGVRRIDESRAGLGRSCGLGATERVLHVYNGAFRDIFATADEAGVGAELRRASHSVFDEDPAHAPLFLGLQFSVHGDLPEEEILKRVNELARRRDLSAQVLLADGLSTALLFLLFVAGEHLAPDAHQALHARVKALVACD